MPNALLERYRALVDESPFACGVAMCRAVVRSSAAPITIEDVARRLGGDPEDLDVLDLDEALEMGFDDGWVLHLDRADGAVTVFENNGCQCSRPEVLEALSIGAEVYSAYWNVNSDSMFSYAVDGDVLTAFEGLGPDYRHGSQPDALSGALGDLYESLADPGYGFQAGMLAVIERRTGVRLDNEWFARPHEAIVIPRAPMSSVG